MLQNKLSFWGTTEKERERPPGLAVLAVDHHAAPQRVVLVRQQLLGRPRRPRRVEEVRVEAIVVLRQQLELRLVAARTPWGSRSKRLDGMGLENPLSKNLGKNRGGLLRQELKLRLKKTQRF